MSWIEIRQPGTNRLLCRYDPERQLVEIQVRRVQTVVDLTQYQTAPQSAERSADERRGDRGALAPLAR